MDFTGQRVVVLGGTSGIGLATARSAHDLGAEVVVASSSADKVGVALSELPDGVRGEVVDVSDEDQIEAFFGAMEQLDHLVFTAGGPLLLDTIGEIALPDARSAFAVRFWGAWLAAKHSRERIRQGGSITLSSGIAGTRPQPGGSVVAPVCGAVEALTRALAAELAPIRVNAVAAGMVRTPLWDDMPAPELDALFARAGRSLPTQRAGEPDDIAKAHMYLMDGAFTTGTVLTVDGGAHMQ